MIPSNPLDRSRINLAWLVRLRWGAISGQLATVLFARYVLALDVPLLPLIAVVAIAAVSNVLARAEWIFGLMAIDTIALTALLYLTGGPYNPFSFLYLVQIALAAVVLEERQTWALVALSLIGSGLLFVDHRPLQVGASHAEHMSFHLRGMWVAFFVAATFIVYFLLRVTRALDAREQELASTRARAAERERLASLATLAAGAAHELSTPLSTITVVAKELARRLEILKDTDALDDVRLIRAEVDRCRSILSQMAADAGDSHGEPSVSRALGELVSSSIDGLAAAHPVEVALGDELDRVRINVPERAFVQALRGIVKNAQDASPGDRPVRVSARTHAQRLELLVEDHGVGMSPEVLRRAGEPFFTTKDPGRGMGLGLFLSRTVVEQLGGRIAHASTPGVGTVTTLELPL